MIAPPTRATLRRYGLTVDDWRAMHYEQGGRCGVCRRETPKLVIDHEHRRGWAKMPPEMRRIYVRGLACPHCNWRLMPVGMTAERAAGVAAYMKAYEERRTERLADEGFDADGDPLECVHGVGVQAWCRDCIGYGENY